MGISSVPTTTILPKHLSAFLSSFSQFIFAAEYDDNVAIKVMIRIGFIILCDINFLKVDEKTWMRVKYGK